MQKLWNTLFGKTKRSRYSAPDSLISSYGIEVGLRSDVGCVRETNQDYVGCVRYREINNIVAILADGMGGHNGGEVASQTAVEVVEKRFSTQPDKQSCKQTLIESFADANREVFDLSKSSDELTGMGTTLVVLVILQGAAYFSNIGDSRLYLFRGGNCLQLSEDHTMVTEMLHGGLLTPEEAESHPDKNVITRAVGTKPSVKLSICDQPIPVELNDSFLLCSDGLYDLVGNEELSEIVNNNSPQSASDALIELAKSRGGHDNISVIIVRVEDLAEKTASTPITRF